MRAATMYLSYFHKVYHLHWYRCRLIRKFILWFIPKSLGFYFFFILLQFNNCIEVIASNSTGTFFLWIAFNFNMHTHLFFFCVKPEPKVIWSFYWSVYFKNWVDVQLQRSYRSLYFTLRTLSARIQLNVRTKYLRYSWTYWIIFVKNQTHFYDCVDLNIFFQIKFRERKKVTN